MIVAYLQRDTAARWLETLNGWIRDLSRVPRNEDDAWGEDEILRDFVEHPDKTARCDSDHTRTTGDRVCLHHAWVEMTRRSS
jgi:hypothetical protein